MESSSLKSRFDYRNNALGFVRWILASSVIISHAGPIAGFFGGKDFGTQWSNEQSLGGVAVGGFFFISGFLITKSKLRIPKISRFIWHRFLRIFPGYWAILLVTAFVIAPIAWQLRGFDLSKYFSSKAESPFHYFSNNFLLFLNQPNISNSGQGLPLLQDTGWFSWNTSIWTLIYEFGAYFLVGLFGVVGALKLRSVARVFSIIILFISSLQFLNVAGLGNIWNTVTDYRFLLVAAPFIVGMLFQLYEEAIPISRNLAIFCGFLALITYAKGGYLFLGQYAFFYFIIWFSIQAKFLYKWDSKIDFSYGVYLAGWPMTVLATYLNLQLKGELYFFAFVFFVSHVYAFFSWHFIESQALKLKDFELKNNYINRFKISKKDFKASND